MAMPEALRYDRVKVSMSRKFMRIRAFYVNSLSNLGSGRSGKGGDIDGPATHATTQTPRRGGLNAGN
jgi:hypothetical protein